MLKQKTIDNYEWAINKLKSDNFDVNNIDLNKLKEYFIKNAIPNSSQTIYLSALKWSNSINKKDELNTNINNQMSEMICDKIAQNKMNYYENELSDREKKNYVQWDVIIKVYNEVKKNMSKSIHDKEDYLILSLYIHHPPRRADYINMIISEIDLCNYNDRIITLSDAQNYEWYINKKKFTTILENDNKTKTTFNHLVKNNEKYYFVFDEYKTYPYYGRQIISVNDKLTEIINDYVISKNLKKGDKLLNMSYGSYIMKIRRLFECYINKSISINILRHSYITNFLKSNPTLKEKLHISLSMSHTITMQTMYEKIENDTNGKNIVLNTDISKRRKKHENDASKKEGILESKRRWQQKNYALRKKMMQTDT